MAQTFTIYLKLVLFVLLCVNLASDGSFTNIQVAANNVKVVGTVVNMHFIHCLLS